MLRRWVLIADTGCAKFLHQQKDGALVPLFPTLYPDDIPEIAGRDKGEHKPGKSISSPSQGHPHKFEPHTEWHEVEKGLFCSSIAKTLNKHRNDFDVLTLIASPKVLGDLRQKLDEQVLKKVDKTIDKDLTKVPVAEIKDYIGHIPMFPPAHTKN